MQMEAQSSEDEYFRERADAVDELNRKLLRPKLSVSDNLFNRIFGNGKPDIRPSGNVDITAGYQGQNIRTLRCRKAPGRRVALISTSPPT